jgi:hypothetical protein
MAMEKRYATVPPFRRSKGDQTRLTGFRSRPRPRDLLHNPLVM